MHRTAETVKCLSTVQPCIKMGELTQDLRAQRDAWDEANERHRGNPLRSVVSVDDLNTMYIDGSQKRLVSRAVRLEPHFTVLDYGCGVGRWTLWFAPEVHRVVGVDLSPKMVEAARRMAGNTGIQNAEHHTIEGMPFPFEDDAFDLVNAVWVLRYIIDDDELARTVEEICRVVRPGGHVTFIEMIAKKEPEFKEHEGVFTGAAVYRRLEQYRSLFEGCGMMMKMSAVSSASPLYWLYALIRDTAKRRSLPDPFSPLAPSIVSASLAAESLTATPMRLLADRGLIRCRHRFLCLQKPGGDRTRS